MKKLFTFLCAVLMSVGMWGENPTVTLTSGDISGNSIEKDGVTLTCSSINGSSIYGPGTITSSIGNIVYIKVHGNDTEVDGSGWKGGDRWSGSATSVSFGGYINNMSSITITFEEPIEPIVAAVPNPSSFYEPTQIANGSFETQPTMAGPKESRIPNGTNQGWNTTETGNNCFEWLSNVKQYHNGNLNPIGNRCVEMNADNAATLYQDLYTYGGDVIRWSLAHAVRSKVCGEDVQYMRVDVGAPLYNGDNIVYPTGVNYDINTNINPDTKATYHYNGIDNPTGHTYGFNGQNLENLKLTKDQAYQWYYVTGVYIVPKSQPVTRFAFVSEDNSSCGNLLDDIHFSTLIGDLSATYGPNNSVVIKGYWGDTDTSKKLIIDINSTPNEVDMSNVIGQNFVITMTYDNKPTEVTIYHEDYVSAARTISVHYSIGDPNNASEIETILTNNNGQTINVIIDRPVLNNMYNTLCLPFDMNATQIAASSLNGVEIFELNSVEVVNDELFLGLSDAVNAVVAGRPYIVKYSAASQLDDLDFENVTINNADLDDEAITMNGVTFKGTFTPFVMGIQNGFDTNGGYLFLGQNDVLYWPNTNNPLKPFRAYFYIDLNSGSSNAPLRFGMPARIGRPAQMPTGVESIQPSAVSSQKVMIDGVLYIIRGEHMYDAQGQIVK